MATSLSSFHCFLLSLLLIPCNVHGGEETTETHIRQQHFHVIGIDSLFPTTVCSTSSKGSKRPQGLEVAHINGPCSPLGKQKTTKTTTLYEILLQDQSRVRSIQSRFSSKNFVEESNARIPATSGSSLGTGNFIVTLGFGTPKQDLPVVFDTGSDLTWIQCQPCETKCHKQRNPIFDPSMSSSYSNISCGSAECSQLVSTGHSRPCTSTCNYGIDYADGSHTNGLFGRETLTLTASDVFPNFQFGCGQNNSGLFGTEAGLLGLGRDKLSLVSQSAQTFGKVFSYCLPPTSSSTGYLAFGDQAGVSSSSIKFTPLLTNPRSPSLYFLSLIEITVAGQKLAISPTVFSSPGTLIDSGTVITRLPPSAYSSLRSVFQQSMSKYPSVPPVSSLLDTCYDISGFDTISIPKIVLNFGGGTDLDVYPSGILIGQSASQVCLAFTDNRGLGGLTILGNKQQLATEVVYDVQGGRIGFGANGCSS